MMAHGHVTAGSISKDTLWLSTTEDHLEEDHHDDDHHHGVNAKLAAAGMVGVGAFVVLFSIALMDIGFTLASVSENGKSCGPRGI